MKTLKNSINNILAFIVMTLLTFLIIFIVFENNISIKMLKNNMNKINYYNKVYKNVLVKVNDFILLDDVQKLYNEYIKEESIKEDINIIINNIYDNKDYKISRYNDFYKIMYDYSNDKEISEKYANEINSIYVKNLFPTMPFKLITKLYLKNSIQFIIAISIILFTAFIGYALYLFNKSYKYIISSVLGVGILIILPNAFIKIFRIFGNFLYTNNYFTDIILKIIYNTFNTLTIIGIFIIITIITLWLIKKIRSEKRS